MHSHSHILEGMLQFENLPPEGGSMAWHEDACIINQMHKYSREYDYELHSHCLRYIIFMGHSCAEKPI